MSSSPGSNGTSEARGKDCDILNLSSLVILWLLRSVSLQVTNGDKKLQLHIRNALTLGHAQHIQALFGFGVQEPIKKQPKAASASDLTCTSLTLACF